MDTLDFWIGQVTVYIFAMIQTIAFAWFFGVDRGVKLANIGSDIKLPKFYGIILKYITPTVLLCVFALWFAKDVLGVIGGGELSPYITDLFGADGKQPNSVAWMAMIIIFVLFGFFALVLSSSKKYDNIGRKAK